MRSRQRVAVVVLARSDSRRLSGKVLRPLGGRPLIDHVLTRAERVRGVDVVVLATTDRPLDDPLAAHAAAAGVVVFRGAVDDVAGRVLACAQTLRADLVVRVNGDSPFLDPDLVSRGVELAHRHGPDLVTNLIGRTFPYGVAVEVVRTGALARAHRRMDAAGREHVTRFLYDHPEDFAIRRMTSARPELATARLVVDTPEDLDRIAVLVDWLGRDAADADHVTVAEAYTRTEKAA